MRFVSSFVTSRSRSNNKQVLLAKRKADDDDDADDKIVAVDKPVDDNGTADADAADVNDGVIDVDNDDDHAPRRKKRKSVKKTTKPKKITKKQQQEAADIATASTAVDKRVAHVSRRTAKVKNRLEKSAKKRAKTWALAFGVKKTTDATGEETYHCTVCEKKQWVINGSNGKVRTHYKMLHSKLFATLDTLQQNKAADSIIAKTISDAIEVKSAPKSSATAPAATVNASSAPATSASTAAAKVASATANNGTLRQYYARVPVVKNVLPVSVWRRASVAISLARLECVCRSTQASR